MARSMALSDLASFWASSEMVASGAALSRVRIKFGVFSSVFSGVFSGGRTKVITTDWVRSCIRFSG